MKYMGSKARHAKEIIPFLMDGHTPDMPYIEPFVGGGNMIDKIPASLAPTRIGYDVHTYLIKMWQAVGLGWMPPEVFTEAQYRNIRDNKDNYPPELVGYVGFALSYGGKWFYSWCRRMKQEGHRVFVSEYDMPDDFICVWEKSVTSSLTQDTGAKTNVERLFTL